MIDVTVLSAITFIMLGITVWLTLWVARTNREFKEMQRKREEREMMIRQLLIGRIGFYQKPEYHLYIEEQERRQ